jgi:hypothetical protein
VSAGAPVHGPLPCRGVGHQGSRPGTPGGVERRPAGQAGRPGQVPEGRALGAVAPRAPPRAPAGSPGGDRPDQRAAVRCLPAQGAPPTRLPTPRRRSHRRAGQLDRLGEGVRARALRQAGGQHHTFQERIVAGLVHGSRTPGGEPEHQDPPDHPPWLRLPRRCWRADRHGGARFRARPAPRRPVPPGRENGAEAERGGGALAGAHAGSLPYTCSPPPAPGSPPHEDA